MALVNPSILGNLNTNANPIPAMQQGITLGQQMTQANQQQYEYQRQRRFMQALDEVVTNAGDFTTREGQQKIIQGLAAKGFGQEAQAIASKLVPAPKPKQFQFLDTAQGYVPVDTETGQVSAPMADKAGNPIYSEKTADLRRKSEADFNFSKAVPGYDKQLSAIGSDMTKRDLLASKVMAEHPYSPMAEKYITSVLKAQSPLAVTAAPPSQSDQDKWVDFLGNKGDYQTFMQGMGGIRGPNKQKAIIDILARTKAKYPDFDVVGAKAGIKQAEDVGNNKVLNLISGVLPNIQNLIAMSDKIQRSPIKVVSKAQLAASRQFSDEDLANFDQLKTLTADEVNQIFAGGKGGSDMSRHMALDLINEQLPPKQFASTVKTLYSAMQNRANGIRQGFQGYGGSRATAQPTELPTAHPQDSEAVKWAKDHPDDPRSGKILKANGL